METIEIQFSEKAIERVLRFKREQSEFADSPLRVYIEGKGCDGFTYGVAFDDKLEDDLICDRHGFDVIVDKNSLSFLNQATIEWVDDERGTGFLVENPNHKKFRGKFFKYKRWKEKLL